MELMQASRQWSSRPDDERFTSLDELLAHTRRQREISTGKVVPSSKLLAMATPGDETHKGLIIVGKDEPEDAKVPTNWAFGQLAQRVGAPAGYLRSLPAPIAATALNYGLFSKGSDEIGILTRQNGGSELAAATGPNYGRIWNADVVEQIVKRFGDGVTGDFTVPGVWGKPLDTITKENTTLYASDRDFFVFLANEKNKIEVPNRRHGKDGLMSTGVFFWNSEVGSKTLGIATFLYDYVCGNRIVWGATDYREINIRHSAGAPDRFLEEVTPAIESYANKSTDSITDAIEAAQKARLGEDKLDEFLKSQGFTKGQMTGLKMAHIAAEDRPIESLWDVAVGATQYAQGIKHQDDRVDVERMAGKVLALASK